jgi:hypothetical protein
VDGPQRTPARRGTGCRLPRGHGRDRAAHDPHPHPCPASGTGGICQKAPR